MKDDAAGGGYIERVKARGHRDGDRRRSRKDRGRQALALASKEHGAAFRGLQPGQRRGPAGAERQRGEIVAAQQGQDVFAGRQANEWHAQRRADRNADGFAIQRIAASGIKQDRRCSEGGGVAEHPAKVVVIGDSEQADDRRCPVKVGKQAARFGFRSALAIGQDAAMQGEADYRVQHRLSGRKDLDVSTQGAKDWRQLIDALLGDEDVSGAVQSAARQNPEYDFALSDEAAASSNDIALADIAKGGDARVVGVGDEDRRIQSPTPPRAARKARPASVTETLARPYSGDSRAT